MKDYTEISKVKVVSVEQTCFGCPSSWVGKTAEGQEVYARYRWGFLRVMLGEEEVFGEQLRDDPPEDVEYYQKLYDSGWSLENVLSMMESDETLRAFCKAHGDPHFSYHGIIDYDTLKQATKDAIDWPEECP